MKYIKYVLLLIFTYVFFNLNTYADTCSYKEQTTLNNDLANIKITYEVVNDNQVNILIYNVTENIYISYKEPTTEKETNIFYSKTNNGKYVISRDTSNIEEYSFQIKSTISNCYGNILTTKKIIKPKYNQFHTLEICSNEGLSNHSYCQKFITGEINKSESEVIKVLQEFLSQRVDKITTQKIEEQDFDVKRVITYSISGLLIVGIIVAIILIQKKRSEL